MVGLCHHHPLHHGERAVYRCRCETVNLCVPAPPRDTPVHTNTHDDSFSATRRRPNVIWIVCAEEELMAAEDYLY